MPLLYHKKKALPTEGIIIYINKKHNVYFQSSFYWHSKVHNIKNLSQTEKKHLAKTKLKKKSL